MAAEFSATDVALNGFRVVWQRPLAVVYWAAVQLVFTLGITAFVAASAGPAFMKLSEMGFQPVADPTRVLALFRQVLPTYIAVMAAILVFYAVISAAMNRAVLRPADDAFGYLRLSSDELRQLGLLAALAGMILAAYIVLVMTCSILAGLLGVAIGAGGASAALVAILIVSTVVMLAFLGVRFSLASAHTFASRRIDILGAWRMTQGRFWPLLGTYAMALALNLVVALISSALALVAAMIVGGGFSALRTAGGGDMSTLQAALAPARLAYLLVSAAGTALAWPVRMTPPAAIYRILTGDATSQVFA